MLLGNKTDLASKWIKRSTVGDSFFARSKWFSQRTMCKYLRNSCKQQITQKRIIIVIIIAYRMAVFDLKICHHYTISICIRKSFFFFFISIEIPICHIVELNENQRRVLGFVTIRKHIASFASKKRFGARFCCYIKHVLRAYVAYYPCAYIYVYVQRLYRFLLC